MEKMLDKKSRDFAKNMRDTMIYDDMANEVTVITDLYVEGDIRTNNFTGYSINADKIIQKPTFDYKPSLIETSTLELVEGNYILDYRTKKGTTFYSNNNINENGVKILTGNAIIIVDRFITNDMITSLTSLINGDDNYIILNSSIAGTNLAILSLNGAIYISLDSSL